jgi:hypothetical protein
MTTIEHETRVPASFTERAVFVTEDDRRSRVLHATAVAAGAMACLWLAGLGIGTLGLGSLPGVSLPHRGSERPRIQPAKPTANAQVHADRVAHQARLHRNAAAAAQIAERTPGSGRLGTTRGRTHAVTRTRERPARRVVPPAAPAAQTPTVAPPTSKAVQRGLQRRSLTQPPGQERKATGAQPQPASPQGQAHGRNDPSSTTTTTPETLPPGQQKPDKPPPTKA